METPATPASYVSVSLLRSTGSNGCEEAHAPHRALTSTTPGKDDLNVRELRNCTSSYSLGMFDHRHLDYVLVHPWKTPLAQDIQSATPYAQHWARTLVCMVLSFVSLGAIPYCTRRWKPAWWWRIRFVQCNTPPAAQWLGVRAKDGLYALVTLHTVPHGGPVLATGVVVRAVGSAACVWCICVVMWCTRKHLAHSEKTHCHAFPYLRRTCVGWSFVVGGMYCIKVRGCGCQCPPSLMMWGAACTR